MTTRPVKVLLYGDVDLNVMDGSAVWLVAMARTWVAAGAEVHVQLKAPERRDLLTGELRAEPGVRVLTAPDQRPPGQPGQRLPQQLTPADAASALEAQDAQSAFDVIMVRGIHACREVVRRDSLAGRLWCYVTEFEYPAPAPDPELVRTLEQIAEASRLVLVQTPAARSVLEALVPAAAGRTEVLTPMIPDDLRAAPGPDETGGSDGAVGSVGSVGSGRPPIGSEDRPLRMVYAGKFARHWRTDLMPQLPALLRSRGISSRLELIGDKIQRDPEDTMWTRTMRQTMEVPPQDVVFAGAMRRSEVFERTSTADVSLGWRSSRLDSSLEISSKVLESCALGVPPVINRTSAHEELLGEDYPLFVESAGHDDAEAVAELIAGAASRLPALRTAVAGAVEGFRIGQRAAVLRGWLDRVGLPAAAAPQGSTPIRVVVAGHDLKFAGELVDLLTDHPGVDLRFDHWSGLHRHDERASRELVQWADVVMCEWAGPNAVWYARHKRPGQRLVVRLHMFELRGAWLDQLDTGAVDRFVTVSAEYRRLLAARLELAEDAVTVIPNAVSLADLDRRHEAPVPDRRFRLGLVGLVPLRKRLDRAVDLLRELHRTDDRYTLHVRGRMPWEYPHEWRKPDQREAYLDLFARLGKDPLRQSVAFEPFGADMAGWLAGIGWILSPSTVESFHLAPAEGMAAGSVPVLWSRPGVREIFGDDFVVADTAAAASRILAADEDHTFAALQDAARTQAGPFDEHVVARAWARVLLGAT
ncbi:glycosyltransferase [Microbacterium sp. A93]|uniref:glycosyltransferase n=1 Tax=Microbacterium sp. A93 TaxID=3450716 RepID=UPI003F42EAA2